MRKSATRTQPPPLLTKRATTKTNPGTVPRCDACKQLPGPRGSVVLKTPCVHFQLLQKKQKQQQQAENNQEEQQHQEDEIASVTCSSAPSSGSTWAGVEHNIITAVRLRPMLAAEKKQGYRRIVDLSPTGSNWTRIVNPVSLEPAPRSRTGIASSTKQTRSVVSKTAPASTASTVNFLSQFTQEFHFDFNFWSYDRSTPERPAATQSVIYEELGVFAVQSAWQGYNCSIFAYGQTSAGKTYTMMGSEKDERPSTAANTSAAASNSNNNSARTGMKATSSTSLKKLPTRAVTTPALVPEVAPSGPARRGLIPRICRGVFDKLEASTSEGRTPPLVHVSYVEIYHEHVYDLLAPTAAKESLKVREHPEDGIFVENAIQIPVNRFEQVMLVIEGGNRVRSVASTNANNRSSRSHAILTLYLTHAEPAEGRSKLCLVDLAGSERVDHSGTTGTRVRETGSINKSLATLADVINALSKRSQSFASSSPSSISSTSSSQNFIPYRNSVLTRLLKESLGGNAKTIMLAAISPCCAHYEETLSTLKYIERAKSVVNVPRISADSSNNGGTLVQELRREICELKSTLQAKSPTKAVARNLHEHVDCICRIETVSVGTTTECSESSPSPSILSHEEEKNKMEREIAKLRAIIKKQERDGLQEQATKSLHDKVSGQILRQHAHLINLVAVYRRMRFVQQFQALEHWRRNIVLLKQCHPLTRKRQDSIEHEENQSDDEHGPEAAEHQKTPTTPDSRKTKGQKSPLGTPPRWRPKRSPQLQEQRLEMDAICYSVVDEFFSCPVSTERKYCESKLSLSDDDNQHVPDRRHGDQTLKTKNVEAKRLEETNSNQVLESSEDCPDLMIDMPSLELEWGSTLEEGDYVDEQVDEEYEYENPENDGVDEDEGAFYEGEGERYGAPTVYRKPSTTQQKQRMQANVSTCLDAIDIARRAMGPTMRKLRKIVSKPPADGVQQFTGMERQLLIYTEKVFLRMIEYMNEARQAIPSAKSFATDRELFVKMEELMNAFCLDVVGRLCAYLIRPAGCAELINPHEILMKQLTIVQDQLTSVLCRMTTESFQSMTLVVVEFFGLTERIKSVLQAIDHKNRQRLVLLKAQQDLVATSAERIHRLQTQVTGLETRCKELSQGCPTPVPVLETDGSLSEQRDEQAATIALLEDNLTLASAQVTKFQDKQQTLRLSLAVQHMRIVKLEEAIEGALNRRDNIETSRSNSGCSTPDASDSQAYTHLFVRLEDELASALTQMNEFETCQSPKTEISNGTSVCTMLDLERECADQAREFDENNTTAARLINTIEEVLLAVSSGDHHSACDQLSSALMITHELVSSHTAAMATLAKLTDALIQRPTRAETQSTQPSPLMRVTHDNGHHTDENARALIKSLEQDLELSRKRIEELETCNDGLRVVCSDQKASTAKLERDYNALASASREQAAHVSSNEANLITVQSELEEAINGAKDWKEQHDQLSLAYESLQHVNDNVAGELMDVISSVESLDSQLAASRTHCATLESSCAAAHDRILVLTQELDSLSAEKAKVESDQSTNTQRTEDLSTLRAQLVDAHTQIVSLEATHASMTLSQETTQARNDQLEQDLAHVKAEAVGEKLALERTHCTRIAELEAKLVDTELRFQVLEEMLATASAVAVSNQNMVESLRHEYSMAATRSSELETALQEANQGLAFARSKSNDLEQCNQILIEGQHSIKHERDLALAHDERMANERRDLQAKVDAQAAELESMESKLCAAQDHLENLQAAEKELFCAYAKAFPTYPAPTAVDVINALVNCTSYEVTRSKYEAQCTSMKTLEDQNNELVLELQQMEEKLAELREANESKALELSEMETALGHAEDHLSTAEETIHELGNTIDLEHASFVETNEALAEASATNEKLSALITELSTVCESEKASGQELEQQLSTLSAALEDWKDKYTAVNNTNELQTSALAQAQDQVKQEQLHNQELSDQVTLRAQEQQKLTQQVEFVREELCNQEILFHEAKDRCDRLENDIRVLNAAYNTKELEFAEKTEAWCDDKTALGNVTMQVAELTCVVAEWKSKYAAQLDTTQTLEQSVTDLRKELGQAKERLAHYESKLLEAEALSEQSNTKLEQLNQENEMLQAESIRLEDQILGITKQTEDRDRARIDHEATATRMQAENQLQLIFHESHITDVESRLKILQSLVKDWEHKYAISTSTTIAQQEELNHMNSLLEEADGRCEVLAEELRLLKQSVPESDHTSEEARSIVLKHLQSLDLWFDRAILQCNAEEEHESNHESVSATSDSLESRILRADQHNVSQRHAGHTTAGDRQPTRAQVGEQEQVRVVDLDDLYHEISSMCCSDEPKSSS